MKDWKKVLFKSILLGKFTGITTTLAAAACGKAEINNPIAPINAISHIFYGDEATGEDTASAKYTLAGFAINEAANISWATIYEVIFGEAAAKGNAPLALLGGAAIAGLAYVTDYHIVPPRLTPGFEKRLSSRSLLFIYVVLALSLGLGGLKLNREE